MEFTSAFLPGKGGLVQGIVMTPYFRLSTDRELQYIVAAVDSVLARIKSIELGALEYSFVLEKTVLGEEGEGAQEQKGKLVT